MANFEAALTAALEAHREAYSVPGYDCSVWHNGKEIYRRKAGMADLETGTPITKDTLYNLYSNTKVISCTAALQLYEKGLFRLDDPLSMYFPEFAGITVQTDEGPRDAETPITVLDVFRMTAGFGDGDDYTQMGMQFYMETGGTCPVSRLPEFLARVPLLHEPATVFHYGISHEVLAALIEELSGESFADYLSNHIFQPLDMKNTAFSLDQLENKALANQYRYSADGLPEPLGPANCLIPPILRTSASGGLISTVDDYMKFQLALMEGEQLLKRETIDLMRTNHLSGSQADTYEKASCGIGYGLGVRAQMDAPGAFGWGGASGSHGVIDPEKKLCIFYMQHIFGTEGSGIHDRLEDIIYAGLE